LTVATIYVFAVIFGEEERILCVRLNYGAKNWTTPGGQVESGESPVEALKREVFEEIGCRIKATDLIGVYAKPFEDDLVLCFEAKVIGREPWEPDHEIAEVKYFARTELPEEMTYIVRTRIWDALDHARGIIRVFEFPESSVGI
jgi:8-oxo-dGTP diphosphatase